MSNSKERKCKEYSKDNPDKVGDDDDSTVTNDVMLVSIVTGVC